jgi:hypothetical protein
VVSVSAEGSGGSTRAYANLQVNFEGAGSKWLVASLWRSLG